MFQKSLFKKTLIYLSIALLIAIPLASLTDLFNSGNAYAANIPGGNNFIFVTDRQFGQIDICQYQNISQSQVVEVCRF